jgi:hypothetical protein
MQPAPRCVGDPFNRVCHARPALVLESIGTRATRAIAAAIVSSGKLIGVRLSSFRQRCGVRVRCQALTGATIAKRARNGGVRPPSLEAARSGAGVAAVAQSQEPGRRDRTRTGAVLFIGVKQPASRSRR